MKTIMLTKKQAEALEPFFEEAREKWDAKTPVAIFAQIWSDVRSSKPSFMDVQVLDPQVAIQVHKLVMPKKGK